MSSYNKAFIYFDTNSLECRHSGKSLFLSRFTVNSIYYEIEKMIKDFGLSDIVQICIPEIVWFELKQHLISGYKSEKSSMLAKIESYKKSFGSIVDIYCEFKDCKDDDEYIKYVEYITEDFLDDPKNNAIIIPYPKDEENLSEIIDQAIHAVRPFKSVVAKGGKEYTDAGFKDALIFHSIKCNTGDNLGILISNDNDFADLFRENSFSNLFLCKTAKEVDNVLVKEFNIVTSTMIESKLKADEYLLSRIIDEAGFDKVLNYSFDKIYDSASSDDGVRVKFTMTVDDECYIFDILYNLQASELIEVSCEIFEGSGS